MHSWEIIYQNDRDGGPAWGCVRHAVRADFKKFLASQSFSKKSALDIGCGFGQYLLHLQEQGFSVTGVDASETAIAHARLLLGNKANLTIGDMFLYPLPENNFDLILSMATMHHGGHRDIASYIEHIRHSLVPGGKIFIELQRQNVWATFKKSQEREPGTVIPLEGPEIGIPHSYFKKSEIRYLFRKFSRTKIRGYPWITRISWIITAEK